MSPAVDFTSKIPSYQRYKERVIENIWTNYILRSEALKEDEDENARAQLSRGGGSLYTLFKFKYLSPKIVKMYTNTSEL